MGRSEAWAHGELSLLLMPCGYAQQSPLPYKLLRYEDGYRCPSGAIARTDPWDSLKCIPLASDPRFYVNFGGEVRERLEYYSPPNFSLQGQSPDSYMLHRLLLNADVHAGDYFRAFVQLGSYLVAGKDNPAPPYLDKLDLQQGFVDVRVPLAPGADIDPVVRVGRQEIALGSQRLVAVRDNPNVRRAFDGVRVGDTIGDLRIDALLTRPVLNRAGVFDVSTNPTQALWGVYSTVPLSLVPSAKMDLYYLGYENKNALYAAGIGEERRQSVGARFFGATAGWDWDVEAVWQFGTFAQGNIRAWTVATNTGYSFDVHGWTVRLGVKADIASGDRNLGDSQLGTFNALYPNLSYLSNAALFAPSNVMDVQPTLTLKPTQALMVTFGYDFLWRATTDDAVYIGAGVPVAGTAGRPGRFTGRQLSADATWQVDRHLQLAAGYVRIDVGAAMHAAGAKDVDFAYFAATYKF